MISIPLAKKIEFNELEENKGKFIIQPLYPGYGLTLGNAIRRVLLSSLPGAAIEAVKIKGVEHEFSTLDWVKEDIVDVILNLKQVRIKLTKSVWEQSKETGEPIKLSLNIKGAKDVKAGDFKKLTGVDIVNPEQKIATLTDAAANLEMEAHIGYGLGYSPTEAREGQEKEVGVIAIDANFTPIKRVGYDIENVRVGEMTNWDKLSLNVETDGTLSCEEAFSKAVNILVEQYSCLISDKSQESESKKAKDKKTKDEKDKQKETKKEQKKDDKK